MSGVTHSLKHAATQPVVNLQGLVFDLTDRFFALGSAAHQPTARLQPDASSPCLRLDREYTGWADEHVVYVPQPLLRDVVKRSISLAVELIEGAADGLLADRTTSMIHEPSNVVAMANGQHRDREDRTELPRQPKKETQHDAHEETGCERDHASINDLAEVLAGSPHLGGIDIRATPVDLA
jgi:hypothetical protein